MNEWTSGSSSQIQHSPAEEADHRIANSLALISSLVRLKATNCVAEQVRPFLLDVAGRIDTVSRLHRLLSRTGGIAVPLAPFLGDVCAAMDTLADGRLRLTLACPEAMTLAPDQALSVGLLVAELISNSIKYAHPTGLPTCVGIAVEQGPAGSLTFQFDDDGVGFPENFDPRHSDGLGMRIVHSLSQRMQGQYEWKDLGIGLRFVCRFPAWPDRAEIVP